MKQEATTPTKQKSYCQLYELKKNKSDFQNVKITSSKHAYEFIKQFYSDDINIFESFFILLVNRNNTTTGFAKISQGGIVGTVVDIKLIAKYTVDSLASGVILAHNHPSGNTTPSEADKTITNKTIQALKLLDVAVLDHIILTEEDYYSFSDNGLI
jgi:DNA repair protein RadC